MQKNTRLMHITLIFLLTCGFIISGLYQIDRYFLKLNDGFCIRSLFGTLPADFQKQPLEPPPAIFKTIVDQPYTYLAKGHQSYVFMSQDQKYVIKFYRFPSHLRRFPFLNHPLSSHFSKKRQQIMAYNLEKLALSFNSYQIAYKKLSEETGTLWVHLQPTKDLQQLITLIDRTGCRYTLPLDSLFFVVQKKMELFFPALENLIEQGGLDASKQMIDSLIDLIMSRCEKGIQDTDPVLEKNYGWDGKRVVSIDIGRFVEKPKEQLQSSDEIAKITYPLNCWLKNHQPIK